MVNILVRRTFPQHHSFARCSTTREPDRLGVAHGEGQHETRFNETAQHFGCFYSQGKGCAGQDTFCSKFHVEAREQVRLTFGKRYSMIDSKRILQRQTLAMRRVLRKASKQTTPCLRTSSNLDT